MANINLKELQEKLGIKSLDVKDLKQSKVNMDEGKLRYNARILLANFSKVFKRSAPTPHFKGLKTTPVTNQFVDVFAYAVGATDKSYKAHIKFYKKNAEDPLTVDTPLICKCECQAFHYWLAYPLLKGNSLYGKPRDWNKVPAYIRNPNTIPTVCKHLHGLLGVLMREGLLKR